MKAFLQQMYRGFEHPFKAVTRPEVPFWGQAESGPKTWTHQECCWSFFSNPPEDSHWVFWQTYPIYTASIRQGSIYVQCFVFVFFPPLVTLTIPTLTFSLTSEKRDRNCIPFYRSAWLKPVLPIGRIMYETHGFCRDQLLAEKVLMLLLVRN